MRLQYQAKNREGVSVDGEMEAASVAEARTKLRGQGLFVLQIANAANSTGSSRPSFSLQRKVSKADLLMLLSQLTIMNQSGVDLAESLRNLADQCGKPALKAVLERTYNDVSSGVSFSGALKRHPHVFDETFVAVIAAGESSGAVLATLERLTILIRGELRLRSTIWSMLMYPLVLCGVTFVVLNALIFFVLPQFATVFAELGRSPPPLTATLLSIGAFVRGHLIELLLAAGALVLAWYCGRSTALVRRARDYFALHAVLLKHTTRSLWRVGCFGYSAQCCKPACHWWTASSYVAPQLAMFSFAACSNLLSATCYRARELQTPCLRPLFYRWEPPTWSRRRRSPVA